MCLPGARRGGGAPRGRGLAPCRPLRNPLGRRTHTRLSFAAPHSFDAPRPRSVPRRSAAPRSGPSAQGQRSGPRVVLHLKMRAQRVLGEVDRGGRGIATRIAARGELRRPKLELGEERGQMHAHKEMAGDGGRSHTCGGPSWSSPTRSATAAVRTVLRAATRGLATRSCPAVAVPPEGSRASEAPAAHAGACCRYGEGAGGTPARWVQREEEAAAAQVGAAPWTRAPLA